MPFRYKKFTGGLLETNSYLVDAPEGWLLFDAPQGVLAWLDSLNIRVSLLVLTHGHFDHMMGAAELLASHGMPVACHPADVPLIAERRDYSSWGILEPVHPVEAGRLLEEGAGQHLLGRRYDVMHVPGHSPGSLCFYDAEAEALVGGDVLFSGGIGRTDLPGGDQDALLRGIRNKILPLPGQTTVLPGHGPATTISDEKYSNPFLI